MFIWNAIQLTLAPLEGTVFYIKCKYVALNTLSRTKTHDFKSSVSNSEHDEHPRPC